jgi:hypothetical protein
MVRSVLEGRMAGQTDSRAAASMPARSMSLWDGTRQHAQRVHRILLVIHNCPVILMMFMFQTTPNVRMIAVSGKNTPGRGEQDDVP